MRGTTASDTAHVADVFAISIHVPLAGDDSAPQTPCMRRPNFYPRPPCGGRRRSPSRASSDFLIFLSTSPLRGTTSRPSWTSPRWPFLSTSPLRGTTLGDDRKGSRIEFLSTSPLRGTTDEPFADHRRAGDFYPRPPCGGRRQPHPARTRADEFLSTSPLRGTTAGAAPAESGGDHFYPRPPCGGRPARLASLGKAGYFYPRPPCGGRLHTTAKVFAQFQFLSTSPLRGTTWG